MLKHVFFNILAPPPPPGFYPQGAPYPKADGGYVPSGGYPTGGGYPSGGGYPTGGGYPSGGGNASGGGYPPPPYAQQNMPYYGASDMPPSQNDSYNASDNFGFNDKTIRKNFIRYLPIHF